MNVYILDDGQSLWPFVKESLVAEWICREHQLVPQHDPQALLELLRQSHEASVTVIGPMLQGMAPLDWVRRVRALDAVARPHLLAALEDDRARAVLSAFEAGVDDCLPAPWQPELFAARVLAAGRLAAHQQRLLTELKQRDQLLSHMVSPLKGEDKPAATAKAASSPAVQPLPAKAPSPAPKTADKSPAFSALEPILPRAAVEELVAGTVLSMGLSESEPEILDDRPLEKPLSLVHFLILPEKKLWLDLLLEAERQPSQRLFEAFSGMDAASASEADLIDALGETLNMIQAALKARFKTSKCEILTPIVPQYVPPEKCPQSLNQAVYSRKIYSVGEIQLRFTLYAHGKPVTQKPLKALQLGDVLAEPLRPDADSELVIINKGTQLAGRYWEKAADLAESVQEKRFQSIIEPSILGLAVCKK